MSCNYTPYTLPTIDFVGGETQELLFHVYCHDRKCPFYLTGCAADFAIVSFTNKTGAPIVIKEMEYGSEEDAASNVLRVVLEPNETYQLCGKYIYQIQIRDIEGNVEIPKQGILYITNNINKSFIEKSAL